MARPLRIESPGAYYHVINRGNAGETIFKSNRDREKFLEYLATATDRFAIVIHSYCLMSNHYHLLIETPEANLSAAIQWLNVSYATYFNRKRKRQGHLFQGRFKAVLVDADAYLAQLSRYIHLNPVKAKIVEKPQDYPWSSYAFFIGESEAPDAIVAKGKKRNQPREIAIYLSLQLCAMPCVELGRYFGGISGSAISMCGKRCAMKVEKDESLREAIEEIQGRIVNS